jgi:hypothetical protein
LKKFEKTDINGDILDRIIIKDRRKEREKEMKSGTQNMKQKQEDEKRTNALLGQCKSQDSGSSSGKKESGARKIKLKRSHSSFSSEVRCSPVLPPHRYTYTGYFKFVVLKVFFAPESLC